MLRVNDQIQIPLDEFVFRFARSGGPGGQNVNRRSTQVILRWPVVPSPSLPPAVKARFLEQQQRRITKGGHLLVRSQRYRDQGRNIADCLEKVRQYILQATRRRRPRKPTRPTKASQERRLVQKKRRSKIKRSRRRVEPEE